MSLPLRRQERSSEQPSRSYSPKDLVKNGIMAIPVQLRQAAISRLAPLQFASNDLPTVSDNVPTRKTKRRFLRCGAGSAVLPVGLRRVNVRPNWAARQAAGQITPPWSSTQLDDGVRGHGAVTAKRRRAHVPVVLAGLARQIMAQRKPPRDRPGWSAMTRSRTTCSGTPAASPKPLTRLPPS